MGSLMKGIILCCLALGSLAAGKEKDRPIVDTQYGKLRGKTLAVKEADRTVDAFYGIPFAKPPVGPLRLARPEPPEPWGSIREASENPPMCLQNLEILGQLLQMIKMKVTFPPVSEDCLYLNIFSPADRGQSARLPVMVFIHGGGLVLGGALLYEGSAMSAFENVVVVSIQYRVGLMGFLSSGDKQLPGNYGFFDQVEALRWVQRNIADFGGDPKSVTIFGESSGGASVSALVLSPLAKGLFHRAISESGAALMPGLMAKSVQEATSIRNVIADVAGCDQNKLLDCFKTKTAEEILSIGSKLQLAVLPASIDGTFLPKPAEQILADKEINPVPFLAGMSEQECGWIFVLAMNISDVIDGMDRETAHKVLKKVPLLSPLSGAASLLLDEYLGDVTDPAEIRDRFLDMCGDFLFVMPALKTAKYHRDAGQPVYFYEFKHRPSFYKDSRPDFVRADHGDELYFVTGAPFLTENQLFTDEPEEKEKVLSKRIMKYWANFARTGNPNGPGLTHWPQYNKEEGYMKIKIKLESGKRLKADKFKFWTTTLPEKAREFLKEEEPRSEL
ncbi:fatty acyl-CoA hydrolase precursor, medium chain-like [Pseudophryne corroboree]|uniref:fatty acyl-CoA hydrolase precursor, medium chain-like n=1 Tax=Pseudophryne corroboree TaxID=495146 RepID=UPI0030817729